MKRLKGGELLLDLTSLGDLSDSPTLTDEQFEIINKLCGYDSVTDIWNDLPKPILCKCIINGARCIVPINFLSDDGTELDGSVIHGNKIYLIVITNSCNVIISEFTLS